MNVISLCMIAIIGSVMAVMIKGYKPEISVMIVIALSMLFLGWMLHIFTQIQEQFQNITTELEQNGAFYKILFKIMGITYICEFSSGICKDAGYASVSSQIEIIGKMLVLLSGMPILVALIETIENYKI